MLQSFLQLVSLEGFKPIGVAGVHGNEFGFLNQKTERVPPQPGSAKRAILHDLELAVSAVIGGNPIFDSHQNPPFCGGFAHRLFSQDVLELSGGKR